MSKLNHTDTSAGAEYATVYVAFELSKAKWQEDMPQAHELSRFRSTAAKMRQAGTL